MALASTGEWFGTNVNNQSIYRGSSKNQQGSIVAGGLKYIQISDNGRFVYGINSSGNVYYTHTNNKSGVYWKQLEKDSNIKKICASSDGSKQWKLRNNGELFESTLV